jgi:RNA polymerase subunit RPABC4/transcription elongation factor Spt4
MPEEEELEDAVHTISDLGDAADLAPCPNCGEMTETDMDICDHCGYLIRMPERSPEELQFEERLTMTLKPGIPSKPRVVPLPEETEQEPAIPSPKPVETAPPPVIRKSPAKTRGEVPAESPKSSTLVVPSILALVAGIVTYTLSFFFVLDRALAGITMVLGAVLIVVFGNVAVEGALRSRRPVFNPIENRKAIRYVCPVCKNPVTEEELECPMCGSVFES